MLPSRFNGAVAWMQAEGRNPGVLVYMPKVVPDSIAFHPGYALQQSVMLPLSSRGSGGFKLAVNSPPVQIPLSPPFAKGEAALLPSRFNSK